VPVCDWGRPPKVCVCGEDEKEVLELGTDYSIPKLDEEGIEIGESCIGDSRLETLNWTPTLRLLECAPSTGRFSRTN
jgi:hypothetical protein